MQKDLQKWRDRPGGGARVSPGAEEEPQAGEGASTDGVLMRIYRAVGDLFTNEVYVLASAIAFNALLSFFPFVLLLLSFCRNVLRSRPALDAVLGMLRDYLPTGQDFIIRNLQSAVASFGKGEVVSVVLLLFTSSGILIPIQIALNRAWGAPAKPRGMGGQLIRDFKDQAMAFVIVLVCGLMGLASTSLVALSQRLISETFHSAKLIALLSAAAIKVLALPLTFALFFTLYFVLPHRRIPVRQALPAAVVAGLLWEASRVVCFGWVFPWLDFRGTYGPFYISVTLVTWAFVSSMILLLGANLSAQNLLTARRRRQPQKLQASTPSVSPGHRAD